MSEMRSSNLLRMITVLLVVLVCSVAAPGKQSGRQYTAERRTA